MVRYGAGADETPEALVLGNLLTTGTLGAALLTFGAVALPEHTMTDLAYLAGIAVLAGASQVMVTVAFAKAPASQLATCEYLMLPIGAALGYAGWGDVPAPATLAAAALVAKLDTSWAGEPPWSLMAPEQPRQG